MRDRSDFVLGMSLAELFLILLFCLFLVFAGKPGGEIDYWAMADSLRACGLIPMRRNRLPSAVAVSGMSAR